MINCKVNGIAVQVAEGSTVLDAAKKANVKIPTLCYNPDLAPWAACGICVVRVEGSNKMLRSCCTPVSENMSVITNDAELVQIRKTVIELILSTHPDDCLACPRNQDCELQTLAQEFGIRQQSFPKRLRDLPIDDTTGSIILNPEEMRPLRPLRDGVPADAERLGDRVPRPRRVHAHSAGRRRQAGREPLHPLRPVLRALPGRRHLRERPDARKCGTPS